jgi:murein DD-endopeptidase MepM/ murein hydrolase activator NlpD
MITRLFFLLSIQMLFSQNFENPNTSPIHVLSKITKKNEFVLESNAFKTKWVKDLKLLLPCKNVNLPTKSSRLPNASRSYRNGTHRGIDFFANWGTDIRAVASGLVVRADHNYKEYPADFRVKMLRSSGTVGHTPSDIFNSVLLGRAVFLDHGFDLIPGFRTISIYAHMSSIDKKIMGGAKVEAGQFIGKTGNSGTKPSTLGTRRDAHLHWEMILQKDSEEIYLGKDLPHEELYNMLKNIFITN